ncbi:MAG: LuxR C-terminal-related transcriptional regulator [Candidatus Brocadiaceae bacterium]
MPLKTDVSQLKKAIQCVLAGELWLKRKQLKDIIYCLKNGHREFETLLTRKEIEIVKAICKGYRNKEIMKSLHMSECSLKKYLTHIYKKVGVADSPTFAIR